APALRLKDLPPTDLVLLSHAHMDHMDLPTLSHFARRTPFVTAAITRDVLAGAGAKQITELGWNESKMIRSGNGNGDLQIRALEVRHWGQRWPKEIERGYNGYVLTREGKSLLFAGDTAYSELFKQHRADGPFEAAI